MRKKIILTIVSIILLACVVLYFTSRPTETEDGSYIPSPLALKLATSPTTDFDNTVYKVLVSHEKGENTYRIKLTDRDGYVTYSDPFRYILK